ncbi:MAG: T9SS type A sorting domain-containing protein, partial [Chitinophagaceae bacterium]|nr:T9SS type A sorting domain-containing protein [Chitinophagaceae bacterium]
ATITGFVNNEDLSSSGVTGEAAFSTTATETSSVAGSTYPITPSVGTLTATNYSFSTFVNGQLTITRAPLTVKADDKSWMDNQSAPAQSYYTRTVTGFKNGETATSVGLGTTTYALSPTYKKGSFGTYTIIPSGTPNPANYSVTHQNGTLYVNDDKSKKIFTWLKCVQVLSASEAAAAGFPYKAIFEYENRNATFVYVPLSPTRNFLTKTGATENKNPPELFQPGIGRFEIYFDGSLLTWTLVTNSESSSTLATSNPSASASSPKCTPSGSAVQGGQDNGDLVDQVLSGKVRVYPNPVSNRLTINGGANLLKASDIAVFDLQGKQYLLTGVRQISASQVELDVTKLAKGVYMIRVQTGDSPQIFRIIKQ